MINYSDPDIKAILQIVNIAFPIFSKLISSIKAKFGKQKSSKIVSRLYQELLKPNPDMALITDMFTQIKTRKAKPIAGLSRVRAFKNLVEEYQNRKIITGHNAVTAEMAKIPIRKIGKRKRLVLPKKSTGILVSKKATGKARIPKKSKFTAAKKGTVKFRAHP